MKKVLIYTNEEGRKNELETIKQYLSNTNAVLDTFHSLQSFSKMDNPHAAINFLKAPVETFDSLVLKASGIKGAVNPDAVASIFGIDRNKMIDAVASQPVIRDSGIRNQTGRYKWQEAFAALLVFEETNFILDTEAVELHLEKFSVFAETSEELEILRHHENFCNVFNTHTKKIGFKRSAGQGRLASDLKTSLILSSLYMEIKPNYYLISRDILNIRKSAS